MITTTIVLLCLLSALALLLALSVIDLRVRLLPNRLVLPFGVLAVVFHSVTSFHYITPQDMLLGALLGGGVLYGIRFVANWHYKQDTLGLGDVKLMLAAGLWLGVDDTLMALTAGAACGLLHGIGIAMFRTIFHKRPFTLSRLEIPAGPGFAVGIVAVAVYKFADILQVIG
jgi:leader peptidase (prepilin peptidase)/N-methyltransferase